MKQTWQSGKILFTPLLCCDETLWPRALWLLWLMHGWNGCYVTNDRIFWTVCGKLCQLLQHSWHVIIWVKHLLIWLLLVLC